MIRAALETFVGEIIERAEITRADVQKLQRDIIRDGLESRDEADVLIALDRAIPSKAPVWNAVLIGAVVDFVVWTARPTGYVHRETASWLIGSLGCGRGPTEAAMAIAFEVVRECEHADEALVAFALRWAGGRLPTGEPAPVFGFAV